MFVIEDVVSYSQVPKFWKTIYWRPRKLILKLDRKDFWKKNGSKNSDFFNGKSMKIDFQKNRDFRFSLIFHWKKNPDFWENFRFFWSRIFQLLKVTTFASSKIFELGKKQKFSHESAIRPFLQLFWPNPTPVDLNGKVYLAWRCDTHIHINGVPVPWGGPHARSRC